MKIKILNFLKSATLVVPFLFFSCEDSADSIVPEPDLSIVDDEFAINAAFEDLDFLTLDVLQSSGLGLRTLAQQDICPTATVTHDTQAKKITVDFGTGCTSPSGVTRKGKAILTYTGNNFLFPGTSIVTTFEGYEVNGLKVAGTRTMTNGGIDLIASKVTLNVKVENGKITWPDNTFVTYSSMQSRAVSLKEAGYEATVTGSASGKSREGFDYTATIKTPLLFKEECVKTGVLVPSLGIVDFSYRGILVSVNYGFGPCDKVVEITYPGGAKEITLD
jgi:hypothetical protein